MTLRYSTAPVTLAGSIAFAGSTMEGSVRMTSSSRVALAAARGTKITMNVASMMAKKIWRI